jgi:hypothetical protein
MKLSNIRGERVFDVIADLIEPVSDIAADEKATKLFKGEKKMGESNKAYTLRNMKAGLPYLLRTYKRQLTQIFAVLEGAPFEEYAEKTNLFTLTKSILEMLNDEALMGLFTSAAPKEEATPLTEDSAK